MGIYRKYISEDADMQTMIFRYSVLVDVFGARLPSEMKCENKLSAEVSKKLLKEPYSEQNDRLIMLYGMGIVDEETVKNLILFNKADWFNDAIALENRVRLDEEREINSDSDKLCGIFTVCANSRKYDEISGVDFDTTEKMLASPYAIAYNGFIHIDKGLLAFMNKAGFDFGYYDSETDTIHIELPENIASKAADPEYDINTADIPIPLDYAALMCCLAVYGKNYAADFLEYAKETAIPFDRNFEAEYEKYINDVKLCFTVNSYIKKREICGDTVNYFDYSNNVMENGELVSHALEAEADYSAHIHIDADRAFSEEELEQLALKKYLNSHQVLKNMIIEIFHCKKIYLYIFRNEKMERLSESEERIFRDELFDFNEIWTVIKECSDDGKLRRSGDAILIPSEYIERVRPEWRDYVSRIVSEQYGRRKRNMIAATLNELKNAAKKITKQTSNREAGAAILPPNE